MKEGIIVVNKPGGLTSHDVVDIVRRKLSIRRVGHAGTLDPLATGVLVILVGKSTRLFNTLSRLDKEYRATLHLGVKTTTGDSDGKTVETRECPADITADRVREVFQKYVGELMQTPPMVSAVKHKGKKLYELARKGIEVERSPRRISIRTLRLLRFNPPDIEFLLVCSSGTYVRQLAEDVAADLGCVGCICELERTRVGEFSLREAVELDDIGKTAFNPPG